MQSINLKLIGESAMLLHSDRGANPLLPEVQAHKALTSKRKKTDDDHQAIARSEYMLGFYGGDAIAIPGVNVKSSLVNGAKLNKLGANFKRAVLILADMVPVIHDGPGDKAKMWSNPKCVDCRSVKVGTSRLMRYRPRLNNWSLQVEVLFDENMVEARQIIQAAENAGRYIGIGDYRPECAGNMGRFRVEEA